MNMICAIINKQIECICFSNLSKAIVFCTLIVCATVMFYRCLSIMRDLIEDYIMRVPLKVQNNSQQTQFNIYKLCILVIISLTLLLIFLMISLFMNKIIFVFGT